MGTLADSTEPDELSQNAGFHQTLAKIFEYTVLLLTVVNRKGVNKSL